MLCGDDSITIPLIALGGHGVVSVVSNEIPREFTKLTQLALANDFAGARKLQRHYLPLMEVNFVESNPIPVKAAMALMGLLRTGLAIALVPAQSGQSREDRKGGRSPGPAGWAGACMRVEIEKLFDEKPSTYTRP